MKEFLKYLYTGKLSLDVGQIIGILRIASFFGMEDLMEACKLHLTEPNFLSAYDLCILYCEVRDFSQDFDDMKAFFTELIPKRLENHMICKILKEIWISSNAASNSDEYNILSNKIQDFDLQEILLQRVQNTIYDILDDPMLANDLFDLPNDALIFIFKSSETCIGELKLFKAIKNKIESFTTSGESGKVAFLKDLANKFVRISQLDVKTLVTDIKDSKIFDDEIIFKAIQFTVAKEVLDQAALRSDVRFIQRGLYTFFDFKHFDLSIEVKNDEEEITDSSSNCYLRVKKDKK